MTEMAAERERRVPVAAYAWLAVVLISTGLCAHSLFSVLPLAQWPASLQLASVDMSVRQIVAIHERLPRAVVALLAGGALGLSGALLQRVLRNPIADPSTLGITAGAQLAIVAATLFFPALIDGHRALVATLGAFAAATFVFLLGWRRGFEPVSMIIAGLLIGMTAASLSAALTLSKGEYLMSLLIWNSGSLNQQSWSVANTLAVQVLIGVLFSLLLVRPLAILTLDDASARSLGVALTTVRGSVAVLSIWLAGAVAAAVGLVSFVGLAGPALVRASGVRRTTPFLLLSCAAGGLLLWCTDGLVLLVNGLTADTVPTGVVTGLVGAPVLIWMMGRLPHRLSEAETGSGLVVRVSRPLGILLAATAFGALAAAVSLFAEPGLGSVALPGEADVWDLLSFRWPRMLAAVSAGGLLAIAGTILQRLTANPMASPEVLGISGGAGAGFAAVVVFFSGTGTVVAAFGAFGGAFAVLVLLLLYASRRHLPSERLLLAGIAIGTFCSAVLSVIMVRGGPEAWQILAWISGSVNGATVPAATGLCLLSLLVLLAALAASRWLAILPLGDAVSTSVGLSMRRTRLLLIALSAMATGAATVVVGPLSFVGLMAPHIAFRAGFVRAHHQVTGAFLAGVLLMILADFGARTVAFPYELPLGLFASLIGAPYLVWLVIRK